ncbi:hypothetical protein ABIA61_004343, partial [Paenibacillus sp. RC21]
FIQPDGMYQNLSVGFCKQNPYSLVVQFSKIKPTFCLAFVLLRFTTASQRRLK